MDINKAFDTVPKHLLIKKINNTQLHNNDKRWLANYLNGRQARVMHKHTHSNSKHLNNGIPQGSILSPILFNLFTHDLPIPNSPNIKINTYVDDITITAQGHNIQVVAQQLQVYLIDLEKWLNENRMTASPQKSSITLLTPDTRKIRNLPYHYILR